DGLKFLAPIDMIVTNIPVPIEPEIVRNVFIIAVPCDNKSFGIAFKPAVFTGIIIIDTPNILIGYTTIKYTNEMTVLINANINKVIVIIVKPIIANHLAPYLSNNLPVTNDITPVIIDPCNNNKPEMSAVYPLASCIYIGINKDGPIKDIIVYTLITEFKTNVLYLNTLIFNNGFVNFNCLVRNITIVTI